MTKLVSVKKYTGNGQYKWTAFFENPKRTTHFGHRDYQDYTQHKNKEQREQYKSRHKKDLDTGDPTRAGFLSYYLLWGDSTNLQTNIKNYKNKFNL